MKLPSTTRLNYTVVSFGCFHTCPSRWPNGGGQFSTRRIFQKNFGGRKIFLAHFRGGKLHFP